MVGSNDRIAFDIDHTRTHNGQSHRFHTFNRRPGFNINGAPLDVQSSLLLWIHLIGRNLYRSDVRAALGVDVDRLPIEIHLASLLRNNRGVAAFEFITEHPNTDGFLGIGGHRSNRNIRTTISHVDQGI